MGTKPREGPSQRIRHQTKRRTKSRDRAPNHEERTKSRNWVPNQEEDQVKGQGHPRKGQERGRALNQEENQVKGKSTKP